MPPKLVTVANGLSLCTTLIDMVFEFEGTYTSLAIGTGFIYEYEDFYYLITNGHCVTGVHPETNKRISKEHAGFPNAILRNVRVRLSDSDLSTSSVDTNQFKSSAEFGVVYPKKVRLCLYEDEEHHTPRWYIHPEFGYQVDVVAVPILHKDKMPSHALVHPLNRAVRLSELEPEVADDIYILGYPFGITDPLGLPIWKRGSIAIEPAMLYKELPMLLVDTATRSGMSGSPVILSRTGIHGMKDGKITDKTGFGTLSAFVGVYSGRYGEGLDAQLGIVWKKEVIEEILFAKVRGTIEFQGYSS